MCILLLFLLIMLMSAFLILNCLKPYKFPPGPKWLPFIGCILELQKRKKKSGYTYLVFNELTEKYGQILGLKLGCQKFVVVSGNNLIRKTLMISEFHGRPDGFFFRVRAFGKRKGIVFADGPLWYRSKRNTIKYISHFGFGHGLGNKYLKEEAEMLICHLKKKTLNGTKMIEMNKVFDIAVLNSLWILLAGKRFSYDDSKVENILATVHEAFKSNDTLGGIISHFPFLRFIIPELSGYTSLMKVLHTLWNFIDDEIENHLKEFQFNQPANNFIDAYLLESYDANSKQCLFDRKELIVICLDLFMAGSKTTIDSLTAIFALVFHHPDWMKTLRSDLDTAVGHSIPTLDHIPVLPRIEAFLSEAMRVLVLTPLGLPHRTTENVSLEGYHIPKDTVILFNLHSANNDESCWEKPEEFRPDRFLDENGRYHRRNEFIPFGLGKRRCLGEIMAKSLIFLFFTNVLHNFDLEIPKGHKLPPLDGIDGFLISPRPYFTNFMF
ncbi:methyl farnesoate epoxidase-like [Microplitis demolitor]|uniref:methyl farnesoate epoxidase-like n=1 Tax=Microplitis demolitor TaxID=69319 RepID=UPI0004CCF2E3|nr:methyl farnesoate epoxidase-like [Microplitis demolitor]